MMQLFEDAGFMRYPLSVCAVLVLAMGLFSAVRMIGTEAQAEPRLKVSIDGVLFWGAFALILGVLGTVIGVIVAAQAIEAAGEVHMSLVWGGIKVSLLTTVFGILILSVSSLIWFGLRVRYAALESWTA